MFALWWPVAGWHVDALFTEMGELGAKLGHALYVRWTVDSELRLAVHRVCGHWIM
jgi:hypothetical protein